MFLSVELWKVSCCSQGPTGCLTSRAKTAKCGSNKKWQTCASNKTATSRQIKLKSNSASNCFISLPIFNFKFYTISLLFSPPF